MRLRSIATALAGEIKNDDVASLAAAVAFKIVLALFPAMLAAIAIFNLVSSPEDIARLFDRAAEIVPEEAVAFLEEPLANLVAHNAQAGGVAVVAIVVGVWAASSAATTLLRALTRAYDRREARRFVAQRLAALAVTLALFLALITIFVLLVTGRVLEARVLQRLGLVTEARVTLRLALTLGRYLLAVVVLMVLFDFIYWIGPDYERRPRWHWVSPGAVFGVISWLVASGLFSLYTRHFGNYTGPGSVYGVFGNAIVFMLWLQLSMVTLLIGAELNQVLHRERQRKVPGGARDEPPA